MVTVDKPRSQSPSLRREWLWKRQARSKRVMDDERRFNRGGRSDGRFKRKRSIQ